MAYKLRHSEIKLVQIVAEDLIDNIKSGKNLSNDEVMNVLNSASPETLLHTYGLHYVYWLAEHAHNAALIMLRNPGAEQLVLAEIVKYNTT